MKLRMLGNQIAVKPETAPDVTTGGIIVVNSTDKPRKGVVVATGPGVHSDKDGEFTPQTIQVGDVIAYASDAGIEIEFDGDKLLIMREEHVIGKFD